MSDDLILDVYFPQFAKFLLSGNAMPAFEKLCAIGEWEINTGHSLDASLCQKFGIQKQKDWPLAPIALVGEGVIPGPGYWFLVHPVHLVLQRDFFTLGEALYLETDEAESLLADLNSHFSQDGLRFMPSKSGNFFYLHFSDDWDVATYLLAEAIGRDVSKKMPQGTDGMKLQSLLNEVQMLLNDHPINQMREQQGLLAVNSVWISGGASFQGLARTIQTPAFNLFADDDLVAGLAAYAQMSCQPLPQSYADWDASPNEGDAVLVVNYIYELEYAWFAPLLQALKRRKLNLLRCHFDVHGMTFTLTVKPIDIWKFWRKTRPVGAFFNSLNQ